MQVRWHKSLTFKLFLLMTLSLGACVTAVSGYYVFRFKDYLRHGLEDGASQRAREISSSVGATFDFWKSLASMPVHYLVKLADADVTDYLRSFVASNRDMVAFAVARESSSEGFKFVFTEEVDPIKFQDKNPQAIAEALRDFCARWIKAPSQDMGVSGQSVFDLEPATGLPLMALALRFRDQNGAGTLWTTTVLWKSKVLAALPNKGDLVGALVDSQGRVFIEVQRDQMRAADQEVFAAVLKSSDARSGTKAYEGDGGSTLAALARVDGFPLAIALKLKTRRSDEFVTQTLAKTVIWSWVFLLGFILLSFVAAGSATKRLASLGKAAQRIAEGEFDSVVPPGGGDEISVLGQSVATMAGQIQSLLTRRVESARLEKEIETARLVQESFLPLTAFKTSFLDVSGACLPASECGGDWWGHFNDGGPLHFLIIADATGHGVGAALVTAMGFSAYKTLLDQVARDPNGLRSPAEILATLHRVLLTTGMGKASMTGFAAIIDEHTGIIRYASAGHCPALLQTADSDRPRALPYQNSRRGPRSLVTLNGVGNPLGMTADDPGIQDAEFELEPGDRLILYTDGLTEGRNNAGKPWGRRGLTRTVGSTVAANAEKFQAELMSEATRYFQDAPQDDDVTVVVVEVAKSWTKAVARKAS